MNFELRKIENRYDKYYSYLKSLSWDLDDTYSLDKNVGVEWLIQKMIGVYNQSQLIALGCIKTYFDLEKKKNYSEISSIVDYRYRRQGIADRLLKEMLEYCMELNVEIVKVNILKNNLSSISQIEKNNFDFIKLDNDIMIYEKKLINNK